MSKIDDVIRERSLKPHDCLYHTNRSVKGKSGGDGSIRVLALHEDNIARCEYKCPECFHEGYTEQPWKRPFSVKCEKCGFRISVPKLRDQAKREAKLEK